MLPAALLVLLCAAPLPVHDLLARAARGGGTYAAPGTLRGAAEEALFRALLGGAEADSPATLAALTLPARALGFRLLIGCDAADGSLVVILIESESRGAGAYVIRIGAARDVLVQAPHALSDKGTLGIALSTFRA